MDDQQWAALSARLEAGETLDASALGALTEDGFGSGTVGLVWDAISWDRATAHLDVDARHHQPHGIVHGGVWCSLVESLASVAGAVRAAASGHIVVGVSNATDFLRAHRHGRVSAVATPIHVGRTQQLWQVEISRTSDGKVVARGQVRLHNLDPAVVTS